METRVECYAGASYPERPRALLVDGKRLKVAEVEHRKRTPGGLTFRVRTCGGRRFSLFYDEIHDSWDVQPLAAGCAVGEDTRSGYRDGCRAEGVTT